MADPACPKQQNSGLHILPPEMLSEICSYLSYASHLALSFTCQDLYLKLEYPRKHQCMPSTAPWPDSGAKPKGYNMEDLLEIEKWPVYDSASHRPPQLRSPIYSLDYFACQLCLKIRSAKHFSKGMMKGKRGKLGMGTIQERSQRFCVPCGITHHLIEPLYRTHYDGGLSGIFGEFICVECWMLRSSGDKRRRICADCLV